MHNYQVHRIVFPLPSSLFPAPCSLLPAPCSLLPKNLGTFSLTELQTAVNFTSQIQTLNQLFTES
ncbi:MAG: hypothetical protein F6J94_08635 [Moorea sp. SIO1F2]|uniref:hypothetical protein n=1 Tax=Moorena sp. SIO1F2 TaxID=2607819 RepID=UPI0013B9B403|nr:hypothetical protein [Moorena sp. SIO1F2]NET82002.1 hypothetical protein [Moorena sp. SIO1F2]